jgi:ParB family transcriptional regulator, chromosome partitioning protein
MNTGADKQRKALGKGLSALLPVKAAPPPAPPEPTNRLPIEAIEPNPMQPRTVFHPDRLQELANSIRANGVIQPLIVRRAGSRFQIVAGERRWRAAQLAALTEVPVVVQDVAEPQLLELALIENIQREDLGPLEIAHAFDRLHTELGLSQEQIARRTGKDRATIANYLRLLKLPDRVQALLGSSRLSMGHAKAILGLPSDDLQIETAERAAAQGLSVRQVEALVQELTSDRPRTKGEKSEQPQDPNVKAAVEALQNALGTRVRIIALNEQRGRIEIEYYSQDHLDRLYQQLLAKA